MARNSFSLAGALGGVLVVFLLWGPLAMGMLLHAAPLGATWYVDATSGNDSNDCLSPATACATIAAAVAKAADGDTVQVAAGTYNEHGIEIYVDITLVGAGASNTVVDAGGLGRVFSINATTVISGVRVQNGRTFDGAFFDEVGAGMLTNGNVTLSHVEVVGNDANGSGGGIFNLGALTLEDVSVMSNTAQVYGGGIHNYTGVLTVSRSTVAGNSSAGLYGGGLLIDGSSARLEETTVRGNVSSSFGGGLSVLALESVVLDRVTVSGNQAANGGGIFVNKGVLTATNTTVSGNVATNNYAGLYVSGSGVMVYLTNSSIVSNTRTNTLGAGRNGIVVGTGASVVMGNTLLAYNDDDNCSLNGQLTSLGNNLADDDTCALSQASDVPNSDPLLAPLADNGGLVWTHALVPGSPALDTGSNSLCPSFDARGRARPFDGDGDGTAVCDIGAVEAHRQLIIQDTVVVEGNSGTTTAVFTVTLAPTSTATVQVDYATVNGTAIGGVDFVATAGTLTFNPGETQKTIAVDVKGDTDDEVDETFVVLLSAPLNADVLDGSAVGTIIDDDGLPALAIADQSLLEGNTGTTPMVFAVTLSPSSASTVTVEYATSDGTATSSEDYIAISGQVVFAPGETLKPITVTMNGDVVDEGVSETFLVQLRAPVNASLVDSEATGTIEDDDTARMDLASGPVVQEGNSGITPATFDVILSTPAAFTVTVDYTTQNGVGSDAAIGGEDFEPVSGTLTFNPGEVIQHIVVNVYGDTLVEDDEVFWLYLSNANPVSMGTNAGQAIVLNDDYIVYLPLILR
nr:Calx-beta domain-containing protein [Ardenticatena sp.]